MKSTSGQNLVFKALFTRVLVREWRLLCFGALSISLGLALALGVRLAVRSPALSFEKKLQSLEQSGWIGPIRARTPEAERALQWYLAQVSWVQVAEIETLVTTGKAEELEKVSLVALLDGRQASYSEPNPSLNSSALNADLKTLVVPKDHCFSSLADSTHPFLMQIGAHQLEINETRRATKDEAPFLKACNSAFLYGSTPADAAWFADNFSDALKIYASTPSKDSQTASGELSALASSVPGLEYDSVDVRVGRLSTLTQSFDINLQIMGFISLGVGAFMIFQIMSLILARYSSHFAILHAQGISFRRQFFPLTALVGVVATVATLLGTALGLVFGAFVASFTSEAVRALYESSVPVSLLEVHWSDLSLGILYGFGSSFAGALGALLRIFKLQSAAVLRTGSWRSETSGLEKRSNLFIFISCLVFASVIFVPAFNTGKVPYAGFIACFALLLINVIVTKKGHHGLRLIGFILPQMVIDLKVFLPKSSAIITQILGLSFCLAIAVKTMSQSFKDSLTHWADTTMTADVWIRSKGTSESSLSASSFEKITDFVKARGNARTDVLFRLTGSLTSAVNTQKDFAHVNSSTSSSMRSVFSAIPLNINASDFSVLNHHSPFQFISNFTRDPKTIESLIEDSQSCLSTISKPCPAFLSEAATIHAKLGPAHALVSNQQLLEINVQNRKIYFKVVAVFQDFNDTGTLQIDKDMAQRLLQIQARPYFTTVYFDKNISDAEKKSQISELKLILSSDTGLSIFSLSEIKDGVMRAFNETFRVTDALYIVCILISFVTVITSFGLQFVLRKTDWAIIWATVYDKSQMLRKLSKFAALQAASAVIFSVPCGYAMAWILVKKVNKQAFGFSLDFSPSIEVVSILTIFSAATGAIGTYFIARKLLQKISSSELNLE